MNNSIDRLMTFQDKTFDAYMSLSDLHSIVKKFNINPTQDRADKIVEVLEEFEDVINEFKKSIIEVVNDSDNS